MGQIDAIIGGLDRACEEYITDLATEIHANVTEDTPVDIGWARAGWVPSLGRAYTGGGDLSPDSSKVGAALSRQQKGLDELLAYTLSDGDVFVSNNAPYISVLNNGSSSQAPAGFVQAGIDRAVSTFA